MKEKTVRVIKIGREALYEFLYENMISEEENLLQVSATEVMNHFAIDWERGEFIFMAHQADSLLGRGKVYRDYSFEELKELCGENEDSEEK